MEKVKNPMIPALIIVLIVLFGTLFVLVRKYAATRDRGLLWLEAA